MTKAPTKKETAEMGAIALPKHWHLTATTAVGLMIVLLLIILSILSPKAGETNTKTPSKAPASKNATLSLSATELNEDNQLLNEAGAAMEAYAIPSQGGWSYASQIQGQNKQTDRDVGAASVGMGFIALNDRYPKDSRWLSDAKNVATWLMAVSHHGSNGIWWNDYVNGNDESPSIYTSFDDGPLGIGDFFWRMYSLTDDSDYKTYALGSVDWLLSQAQTVNLSPDGARIKTNETGYKWAWDTSTLNNLSSSDNPPLYSSGMGMGAVGIINTLATYYQRTHASDPVFAANCQKYLQGALNYLDSVRDTLGSARQGGNSDALPETEIVGQNGDTAENSGYLSGAAGAAYMYLNLYQIFNNTGYLNDAKAILSWITSSDGPKASVNSGIAWHIAIDPQDSKDPNNAMIATGFEEGSAGIGWTYLQAYNVTHDKTYLTVAEQAADWLLSPGVVITNGQGGDSWPEDYNPTSKYIHPNLDNGAAGIGMFLYDLYRASSDSTYLNGSQAAANWLNTEAVKSSKGAYWQDNDDGQNAYKADMSYHWGNAGIVADLSRLTTNPPNKALDIPGEEPGL